MTPSELQSAWLREVEADAERGVIQCRICKAKGPLDAAVTLWRNGRLVFAVCDGCAWTDCPCAGVAAVWLAAPPVCASVEPVDWPADCPVDWP